jgi:hypothetical protein
MRNGEVVLTNSDKDYTQISINQSSSTVLLSTEARMKMTPFLLICQIIIKWTYPCRGNRLITITEWMKF